MNAYPKRWKGRELKNSPKDTAKLLTCLLNFLMQPEKLGNMPGDAVRYDEKGILKIIKEEVFSDPEAATENSAEKSRAKARKSSLKRAPTQAKATTMKTLRL